ncbi:MAG: hypothetical protein KF782_13955 [Labilithrix sp.]|nr:hypothetical protein [Labilithrix sp.]
MIVVGRIGRDITAGRGLSATHVGAHISNCRSSGFVWFQVLAVLGSLAARGRASSSDGESAAGALTIRTRVIATFGLLGLASLARSHPSWLVVGAFFGGLALLLAMEVKGGVLRRHDLLDHPPTGSEPLGPGRAAVAIVTLALFALLFMPEPFSL